MAVVADIDSVDGIALAHVHVLAHGFAVGHHAGDEMVADAQCAQLACRVPEPHVAPRRNDARAREPAEERRGDRRIVQKDVRDAHVLGAHERRQREEPGGISRLHEAVNLQDVNGTRKPVGLFDIGRRAKQDQVRLEAAAVEMCQQLQHLAFGAADRVAPVEGIHHIENSRPCVHDRAWSRAKRLPGKLSACADFVQHFRGCASIHTTRHRLGGGFRRHRF